MLDEFKVGLPAGFPDHPHRGFETVTFMLPNSQGSFLHEDFAGNAGEINAGDLQWMTAGRGIMHSEMPKNSKIAHGLQLWINLGSKDKMCAPRYQEHPASDVRRASANGVDAWVIAGSALGVDSQVDTKTPVTYLYFSMQPGATLQQPVPPAHNCFAYTLTGQLDVGGRAYAAHHTLALGRDGDGLSAACAGDTPCSFVLISGQPLGEPIVQHGPFVMNTQREIMQAFTDFQCGANGFENAPGWRSECGKLLGRTDL